MLRVPKRFFRLELTTDERTPLTTVRKPRYLANKKQQPHPLLVRHLAKSTSEILRHSSLLHPRQTLLAPQTVSALVRLGAQQSHQSQVEPAL